MNNVFEFFASAEDQKKLWKFIFHNVNRKDVQIVTLPSIQESLSDAHISFDWKTVLVETKLTPPFSEDEEEIENFELVHLYHRK